MASTEIVHYLTQMRDLILGTAKPRTRRACRQTIDKANFILKYIDYHIHGGNKAINRCWLNSRHRAALSSTA